MIYHGERASLWLLLLHDSIHFMIYHGDRVLLWPLLLHDSIRFIIYNGDSRLVVTVAVAKFFTIGDCKLTVISIQQISRWTDMKRTFIIAVDRSRTWRKEPRRIAVEQSLSSNRCRFPVKGTEKREHVEGQLSDEIGWMQTWGKGQPYWNLL